MVASSAEESSARDATGLSDTLKRFNLDVLAAANKPAIGVELIGSSKVCRESFRLVVGTHTVGRDEKASVCVQHPYISRRHATIEVTADEARLIDAGSNNGTHVNGQRVSQTVLHHDDVIIFGKVARFIVAIEQPNKAKPPVEPSPAAAVVPPTQERPAAAEARVPYRAQAPDEAVDAGSKSNQREVVPRQNGRILQLENESRQLAILFQLALRCLSEPAGSDPTHVLFPVLDRIFELDAAFLGSVVQGNLTVEHHPAGKTLADADCIRLLGEGDPTKPLIFGDPGDELELDGVVIRSRVVVPVGRGRFLCLLSGIPGIYVRQLDFISLVGKLFEAAATRPQS